MNGFKYRALLLLIVILPSFYAPTQANEENLENRPIRMATTTSTDNSGLLSYLLPKFKSDAGYDVHVIAVGTGKALRLGEDGDVDLVLVHARKAEEVFVNKGFGVKRHPVMHNTFVIIGDKNDPAKIMASTSATEAFFRIRNSESIFISRGDGSGTHKKEMSIWNTAAIKPKGNWYREAGQGMGKVIQIADELGAYTLADRGTWLNYKDKVELELLYEGDTLLFNPYGIIAVNPKRYPDINSKGANVFINWLTSSRGQHLIGQFKKEGELLFTSNLAE